MILHHKTIGRVFRKDKSGFTLIELLVVVLIIGILASVGIQNYYLSVQSARIRSQIFALRPLASAQVRYHMAKGEYTTDISQLDVSALYTSKGTTSSTYASYNTDWGVFILYNYTAAIGAAVYPESGQTSKYITFRIMDLSNENDTMNTNGCAITCSATYEDGVKICSSVGDKLNATTYCMPSFNERAE